MRRPEVREREMKIRMAMLLKGVKMKDMAEDIGISLPYCSQVIKGYEKKGEYTKKILDYLGINS